MDTTHELDVNEPKQHSGPERRQEKVALPEGEARLRRIAESGMIGVLFWELSGRVTYANDLFLLLIGRTREQLDAGLIDLRTHTPPEWADIAASALKELKANGVTKPFEMECIRSDGVRVPVLLSTATFPGTSERGVTLVIDLTERKRAEERQRVLADAGTLLSDSLNVDATLHSLARLIVSSLADYCLVDLVEPDGTIRRLVAAHRDPAREELARRLCDYQPGFDPARYGLTPVLERGESVLVPDITEDMVHHAIQSEEHLRVVQALGSRSAIVTPLIARQRTLGAVTLVSAESGRRYTDEDLATVKALAGRAALAVDNAQLYAQALRAVQDREGVIAMVSHDLRSPLNAITMASSLLLEPGISEERKAAQAAVILRSADNMTRLIQDLLDATRLHAGALPVQLLPEEPAALVRAALDAATPAAEARQITLSPDVPATLPHGWADRDRLLQVFANLLDNAIRFTPTGGRITVSVRLARQDNALLFTVTDGGPGVEPQALPFIFDRFWQGKSLGGHGAGLGLAIAKGIVEAHGGRIWAENCEHGGARFSFTLPLAARPRQRRRRYGRSPERGSQPARE